MGTVVSQWIACGCMSTFPCCSELVKLLESTDGRSRQDSSRKHAEVTIDVNSLQCHVTRHLCVVIHVHGFAHSLDEPRLGWTQRVKDHL